MSTEAATIELRRFALEVAARLKIFETTAIDGHMETTEKSINPEQVVTAARSFERYLNEG